MAAKRDAHPRRRLKAEPSAEEESVLSVQVIKPPAEEEPVMKVHMVKAPAKKEPVVTVQVTEPPGGRQRYNLQKIIEADELHLLVLKEGSELLRRWVAQFRGLMPLCGVEVEAAQRKIAAAIAEAEKNAKSKPLASRPFPPDQGGAK